MDDDDDDDDDDVVVCLALVNCTLVSEAHCILVLDSDMLVLQHSC